MFNITKTSIVDIYVWDMLAKLTKKCELKEDIGGDYISFLIGLNN